MAFTGKGSRMRLGEWGRDCRVGTICQLSTKARNGETRQGLYALMDWDDSDHATWHFVADMYDVSPRDDREWRAWQNRRLLAR